MTVYSCEFQSGPQDAAGNVSSSIRTERINAHAPGFASSSDYDSGAPTVLNSKTGDRRSVLSDADLLPDDVVEVGGIPMTVAQARSAGVEISVGEAGEGLNWQAPGAHEEEEEA